ncbi:ABC transporter permease [Serpentinicella alkaliphila]|uniref:Putative ABC transport system permease protein n=1 Tax=Serpentinicella alkaliphila TaxID=1734049 RepID=A0A4R2TS28_9FIRM|nr:FtsX-like permease family protein [Serpentinicella alkaliphila]QUH25621.1 ABC transporter permease [Serpentinicella alkaliphila]TCQ06668.1 putative ABC transport system permease protein [Serpentinicella alkaliphila]
MQLYNITLNNLLRRKAKMFFVLLGLSIGIATIVSVYSIVEAMKIEMTRQVSEFGVNVVITPDSGGLTFSYGGITLPEILYDVENLTLEDVEVVSNIPSKEMVKIIAPKFIGTGHLENHKKVILVGANIQEEFLIKPWLRIKDESNEPAMVSVEKELSENNADGKKMDYEALDLARQNLEDLNLQDNQVILGYNLATSLNLVEGDILKLSGKEYEVSGILEESGSSEDQQVLMNLNSAQELLERVNEITIIEMAVDYISGSEEALISEINESIPHAKVASLRQETLRRDEMLVRLVRFGITLSAIILLVGMLVVALTMSNSVRERTREIGIFRAIGFRKYHIAKMIIMEGLSISILGGFTGFIAGTLMARYAGPFISDMNIVVPWSMGLLAISVGLAIVIGVVSSIYPAYKASNQDPAESLRFI